MVKALSIQSRISRVLNNRQLAYLDAMDIGVWGLRDDKSALAFNAGQAPGLKLGSGMGGILLICAIDSDSASRLANDIDRALGSVPVWAWPQGDANTVKLKDAVEERLFTAVAIFGTDLAKQFFGEQIPVAVNSAKLIVLPSMQDLNSKAKSRQFLWDTICREGLVSSN